MNDPLAAARTLFLEGVSLYEQARHGEAAQRFEAALALAPGRVSVLINLGATRLRLGQPAEAIEAIDTALAAEPHHADAWCHRGLAAVELERHEEALCSFGRALSLAPGNVQAAYWHAVSLGQLQRHTEALDALAALLARQPDHAEAWMLHGQTLRMLERHAEALASYQRAVATDPGLGPAWSHLGQLQSDLGRRDEAAAAFERAIACGADVDTNRYFLAALGRGPVPASAPPHYVRALFDGYADDFESHLVNTLHYRAHEAVAQAARQALQQRHPAGGPPFVDSALELGCGTGLCGPLLKPLARRLDGVDLSQTMLAAARRRGAYDTLVLGELAEHLHATPLRYGLVACADTFIYLGDLSAAWAGVRRVLEPGGCFVFSVERADEGHDFALTSHLRYAHSERYLRRLAAEQGWAFAGLHRTVLREEQRQPVEGLVVCLTQAAGG